MQVREVKRNKIVYYLCCENCGVPREIAMSEVDTIVFNQNGFFSQELSRLSAEKEAKTIRLENEVVIPKNASKTEYKLSDNFIGLALCRGEDSPTFDPTMKTVRTSGKIILIPLGSKVAAQTDAGFYRGKLDAVAGDTMFLNRQMLPVKDVKSIKFRSAQRFKNAIIYTSTGIVSAGLATLLFNWIVIGSGPDTHVTNGLNLGLIFYAPVGLSIGLTDFSKKKMKFSKDWNMILVE